MSLYGLLKIKQEPSVHDIEDAFDGNLCRCTGYRPILDSARTFAKPHDCGGDHGNSNHGSCSSFAYKTQLVDFSHFKAYDPNADVPFPSGLIRQTEQSNQHSQLVVLRGSSSFWIKPSNLNELLEVKHIYPSAKLVGGNSEIGVEMKFKNMDYNYFVYISDISELQSVRLNENSLEIGVNITLNELIESLKKLTDLVKPYQQSLLKAFLSNLR